MNEREVKINGNLDEVVEKLIEYRNNGEKVYCFFNGHTLYSRNVTVDSAYLECTGHTRQEFLDGNETMADYVSEARESKYVMLEYLERGKKVIFHDKVDDWKELVTSTFNSIHGGVEVMDAVEIMEELASSGDIAKAISLYKRNSENFVEDIVTKYAPKGAMFWKALHPEYIEMIPENTLELTVKALLKAKDEGRKVFCHFNDTILKSDTVTMDDAFLEVLGITKSQYDKEQREFNNNFEKMVLQERRESLKKIPELIERGKAYIFPEKLEEWKNCVIDTCDGPFDYSIVEQALDIMDALEKGAQRDELIGMLREQGHNDATAILLRRIVLNFSKRGPDFFEETNLYPLTEEDIELIQNTRENNEKLMKYSENPQLVK